MGCNDKQIRENKGGYKMIWLAVNSDATEMISNTKPHRESDGFWSYVDYCERLPMGTIEKFIYRKLIWNDEPVKLKEQYK